MHTITLSFSTLTELSAAVAKLTGAAPEATAAPAPAVTKTKPAETKAAAPTPAAEPAASPAPAPKAPSVDYPTLQKSVFELAGLVQKKGLDSTEHVLSIAVKHGAPNFKGLDASVYAAALADVKAKIAEVAAMEEAVA